MRTAGRHVFFKQHAALLPGTWPWLVEKDGSCLRYSQFPGELTPSVEVDPATGEAKARKKDPFGIVSV